MFYDKQKDGYLIRVRLSPNSSSCRILGLFEANDGVYLKIAVISVPEKGKANKELVDFLAKTLKIAKSNMEIKSGELDKYKKVFIKSDEENLGERLDELSKSN